MTHEAPSSPTAPEPLAGGLWNTKDVASYLNVKEATIRYWVHVRYVPYIKFRGAVRFRKADIDTWLSQCTAEPRVDASTYASRLLKSNR